MTKVFTIAFLAILVAVWILKGRRRTRFFETGGWAIFQDVYDGSLLPPRYEYRWSYGYPSFTVKFKTVKDKITAETEGRNGRFSAAIEQLCKGSGSRKYPFDVAKAVGFISQEEIDSFVDRVKLTIQQSQQNANKAVERD